jgi:Ca-activated chloride channel family protein
MIFAFPWAFVLLPLAVWQVFRGTKRQGVRIASVEQWSFLGQGRSHFLWTLTAFELLFLFSLITAMARPQAGSSESVEEAEGIAIELLVDVSSSMDRAVILPDQSSKTRMDIAKEMLELFIIGDGEKLGGRPDDLIGLISFARYADTRSPLTFGHKALAQIVRNLEIQDRPNEDGTAYGDALTLACARLRKLDEVEEDESSRRLSDIESRVVVLLTDGENNSGNHLPLEAAGLAKLWGSRIYTISLSEADAPVLNGVSVGEQELTAAEQVLMRISDETGGVFRRATGYESLRSIYEEIDMLETSKIETRNFAIVSERFWVPLLLALAFLGFRLWLQSTWLRVTI